MTRIRVYCDWHKRRVVVGEFERKDRSQQWQPVAMTTVRGWRAKKDWLIRLEEMRQQAPTVEAQTEIAKQIDSLKQEFEEHGIDVTRVAFRSQNYEVFASDGEAPYIAVERTIPIRATPEEAVHQGQKVLLPTGPQKFVLTCPSCKTSSNHIEHFNADQGLLFKALDAVEQQQLDEVEVHALKRIYSEYANQAKRKLQP